VTGDDLARAAAALLERTTASSGVPRTPTDPQAIRRTAAILSHADSSTRGGGQR